MQGERVLRGSALYAQASMVNHGCLPTVARVDQFDADSPQRTHLQLRALHALPAGEEALLSYVPLHWPREARQEQCRTVYEFDCSCPRCVCECLEERGAADSADARAAAGLEEGMTGTYIHIFLLKYVCTRPECFGTFVPVGQRADGLAVCNICGRERSEAQFLAELEAG